MSESIFSNGQNEYGGGYGTVPDQHYEPSETPLINDLNPDGTLRKNWPFFFPIIRHNIGRDILIQYQSFLRFGYFGWWFHVLCLVFNSVVLAVCLSMGATTVGNYLLSIVMVVGGIPVSFVVYWLLYRSLRKERTFFMALWFFCMACEILYEGFCAFGWKDGGGGFILMVSSFGDNKTLAGLLLAVSTLLWILLIIFNISLILRARLVWNALGGHQKVASEVGGMAVQAAKDNREAVAQAAWDNREAIAQVAYDNREVVQQYAYENRGAIAEAALSSNQTGATQSNTSPSESRPSLYVYGQSQLAEKEKRATFSRVTPPSMQDGKDPIHKNEDEVHGVFGSNL